MPVIYPSKSARKRTPSSALAESPLSIWVGSVAEFQSLQGQSGGFTVTTDALDVLDSMLPLSSVARVLTMNVPKAGGCHA
jgi:hypothetical protein